MREITISLNDEVYQQACIKAAAMGVSVSVLVERFLFHISFEESAFEKCKREERILRDSIRTFSATNRLNREDVHDRHALR
ncbi:MAG: hypothetical protein H7833_06445 [Magnetococcus sp. DMHC-1]|nr:hypothetical protein [Magnetococcales bacterium]